MVKATSPHRAVLIGVWCILLLGALFLYYGLNAPLRQVAVNLKPLLLALFFLLSFSGFGFPISRRFAAHEENGTQVLFAGAFGIGATALFIYFLGWAGKLEPVFFLAWTLTGFILFVLYALRLKFSFETPVWNLWNTLAAIFIATFLIQAIPSVVAPELTTDALEFHLLVPKIYLVTKDIGYIPRLVESNYPSLAEYIYTLILGLTSDATCKAFHFWTGILLLFGIAKLAKTTQVKSPSLAVGFFISMPVAAIVIGWAWNDLLFTFFIVLCLLNLVRFHNQVQGPFSSRALLLAGVMAGLASCTKYTFVMISVVLFVVFLIGIFRWGWKWKHLMIFGIPIVALSCIWLVKNFILTGNPFYPFLNSIFNSPTWNSAAHQYFLGTLSKYEMPQWSWKTLLSFPFHLTIQPRIMDVHTGIIPLLLVPLAFMRSQTRAEGLLKTFTLFYLLAWLFFRIEVRSLFSLLAPLLCIYTAGLQRIQWPNRKVQGGFVFLIVLVIASNFFMTIFSSYYLFDPLKYFFGRESAGAYRTRLAESQRAYDFLNMRVDVGKVMLIGIHNPFYLRYEPVFSSCCDPPVAEWVSSGAKNAREIAHRVRASGITHIVWNAQLYQKDNQNGLYSWSQEQKKYFEEFLVRDCTPLIKFGKDLVVLHVQPAGIQKQSNGRDSTSPR